jgi:hypothetical protein
MDVVIVELAPDNDRLLILALAMRDACRVAGIPEQAAESEAGETNRLRLLLARSIIEGLHCGESDPVKLRVAALRSTMCCCVSEGELRDQRFRIPRS